MFDMKHVYETAETALIVAGVTATAATGYSAYEQNQSSSDQRRARNAERRMQAIKMQRERRRQVREAQRMQAQTEATAVATGTTKTSAVAQAQGSVQSQLASNLSFLDQMKTLTDTQSIFAQKAADHERRAGVGQAVSSLAMSSASLYTSYQGLKGGGTGND